MDREVVILEDERLLRDALAAYLPTQGFTVRLATADKEQFLEEVFRRPPAVALVDLRLGSDSDAAPAGLAVLEWLRDAAPETRAVVLSASTNPDHARRAVEFGAAAFLDKHALAMANLAPTLERIASGERLMPVPDLLPPVHAQRPPSPADQLTSRERDVLRHVAVGADNLKIAAQLGITERTVRAHVSALYRKLTADNRTELALIGRRLGLVPRD